MSRVRVLWRDPAIWRDIAYLLGMFVPLVTLDLIVLTVWLVLLAGITLPAWYWAPWQTIYGVRFHGAQLGYFPNGPHGHPATASTSTRCPRRCSSRPPSSSPSCFQLRPGGDRPAHAAVARNLLGAPRTRCGGPRGTRPSRAAAAAGSPLTPTAEDSSNER